jgi:hypothetical protein
MVVVVIGVVRFNPYKIHGIGAPCRFSVHSADRTPAAAILNKKCLLRTGTVSVRNSLTVSVTTEQMFTLSNFSITEFFGEI